MQITRQTAVAAGLVLLAATGTANAQNLTDLAQQNYMMGQQQNMQMLQMQRMTQAYGQQMWANYMKQAGPVLRQEYQQYLAAGNPWISFEQFAYYMLITANGTNVQGALQQQQRNFAGLQQANRTQQQGFADYNAAMQRNSQITNNAIANYDRRAIRGLAPYTDPNSGETHWLPYSQPPGQVYNNGGNSWVQDQSGNYYQLQGNNWVRMDPGHQ